MIKKQSKCAVILYHVACIILGLFFFLPILWALVASFRPENAVFQGLSPLSPKVLLPVPFTTENYMGVFTNKVFTSALMNTFFVCFVTVVIGVAINALAGFTLAVMDFPLKKSIFAIVIFSFLMPADLLVIPSYNIVDSLGLVDTKLALILPMLGNGMVIFMFMQFFSQIPKSIAEAATIDGAGYLTIMSRIYVPLSIPTMIGASLIMFINQWEAFLWPLVVSRSINNRMIQVALSTFTEQHGTQWGMMLAAATLLCFVPLAILIPFQKYYIASVAGSAVKG